MVVVFASNSTKEKIGIEEVIESVRDMVLKFRFSNWNWMSEKENWTGAQKDNMKQNM